MELDPSSDSDLLHDFAPRLRVYKNGRIERLLKDDSVSPGLDSSTTVLSKDISTPITGVSARLYLPPPPYSAPKLPLLIYIHGGAFCLYSASSSIYHRHLNSLSPLSRSLILSIDYRIAPEHPMPTCYDDCLLITKWALSTPHSDPWLAQYADLDRIFLAGDSAGANIVHDVITRVGPEFGPIRGWAMVHPFFGDDERNGLWEYLYPGTSGVYDPRLNPFVDPGSVRRGVVGCGRVLVCVGGKDFLRERGVKYYEVLREKGDGWDGEVDFYESKGRGHVFHLYKPDCDEAVELVKRVAAFINETS